MTATEQKLFPGEKILFRTRLHWLVIARHIMSALTVGVIMEVILFLILFGLTFTTVKLPAALNVNKLDAASYVVVLLPFALVGIIGGWLDLIASELALTNQRVLIKTGSLRRRAFEVNLSDERTFRIRKPPLSKLLGFKTLTLSDGRNFSFVDPADLVQKKEAAKAPKAPPLPPEEKLRPGQVPRTQHSVFEGVENPTEHSQRLIRQASEQIKHGHLTEAKAIVRELLKIDPDNANVWYLAGHLASSPRRKKEAFERALSLDPGHKKARQALDLLAGS